MRGFSPRLNSIVSASLSSRLRTMDIVASRRAGVLVDVFAIESKSGCALGEPLDAMAHAVGHTYDILQDDANVRALAEKASTEQAAEQAAVEAMALFGAHVRADALDALKGDYYRKVREAAEQALARVGGG